MYTSRLFGAVICLFVNAACHASPSSFETQSSCDQARSARVGQEQKVRVKASTPTISKRIVVCESEALRALRIGKRSAITSKDGVPTLPGMAPSPLLCAAACYEQCVRFVSQSQSPNTCATLKKQLWESAKLHAVGAVERDTCGGAPCALERLAGFFFEEGDLENAKIYYERFLLKGGCATLDVYRRLITCYETANDFVKAADIARKLVQECPDATKEDLQKFTSLEKVSQEFQTLAGVLSSSRYLSGFGNFGMSRNAVDSFYS
ncbi:MAG: hypothetical protein LCH26_07180 [Proteobacteria bacterium]|nr:hypothetical protein [Pseudomonadota bacterium]